MTAPQEPEILSPKMDQAIYSLAIKDGDKSLSKGAFYKQGKNLLIVSCAFIIGYGLFLSLPYFDFVFMVGASLILSFSCLLRYLPILFTPISPISLKSPDHLKDDGFDIKSLAPADDYPIYTILVPLFKEAVMLPHLMKRLLKLNWPRSKLDVKLILEEIDEETRQSASQLALKEGFEIIIVPNHAPRTKGKACNYALLSARGEFVTIFDAEDHPDPDQLLRAWHIFSEKGDDIAFVQTPLSFFNSATNWLTKQFHIEYMAQFLFFMPFLMRNNLPIFLGGSSNHFRMDILRHIHMWDPFNVTEDADIGLRLHRFGYRGAMVASLTNEEAVCQMGSWIKQRTRWIKGWIQTWLVAMRAPSILLKEIGWRSFLFLQILVPIYILSLFIHLCVWPLLIWVYWHNPFYSYLMGAVLLSNYFLVMILVRYGLDRSPLSS